MIELLESQSPEAVIKVVGVGGCGGNAVDHMINNGVQGVEFISMNTDAQALKRNLAKTTLQLGTGTTKGLGAGANPEIGRLAAEEDRERITELVTGADMLFITAGMGGGTGTGAAPVVAEIAREMGILTVAVVTKPFSFEGKRQKVAAIGIDQLKQHVDSLIIIPNDRLMQVLGEDVTYEDAFRASNDVLNGAVAGIAEVINCPGMVNVDFADVRTVMSENGVAMMGSATASGPERAQMAAEQAVHSPLLEDIHLSGARGVLVNITAGHSMKLKEVHEVMNTIRSFTAEDATVIYGSVIDEAIGDALRVTIVATGLGGAAAQRQQPVMQVVPRTGTDDASAGVNYEELDQPTAIRRRRDVTIEAMRHSGVDMLDIPAFLRKQAD
ncbi:MAG TPA: cell division protein FtsZ [Usitatibacter sp.]|jgi:cell division protein FtsZ|nr:cell division protein FtsZ [Usitatibacter sp.]